MLTMNVGASEVAMVMALQNAKSQAMTKAV